MPFSKESANLRKQKELFELNTAFNSLDFDLINNYYCFPSNETRETTENSISYSLNSTLKDKAYIIYSNDFKLYVFNRQKTACIDEIILKNIEIKSPCTQNLTFNLGFWDLSKEVKESC
jgi:hypothetical protein